MLSIINIMEDTTDIALPTVPESKVWEGRLDEWIETGQTKKQRYVRLRLDSYLVSLFDIFALARCRMSHLGIFQISLINPHSKLIANRMPNYAHLFGFKLLSRRNYSQSIDLVFRFVEQEVEGDYEFLSADYFEDECKALFEEVFNEPMSGDFWRWKYSNNFGNSSIVVLENGKVCGHYGGAPRVLVYRGMGYKAIQAGDVCIKKKHRSFYSKSVFGDIAQNFILNAFGSEVDFIFGFPHSRAYNLGKRLGIYSLGFDVFNMTLSVEERSEVSGKRMSKVDFFHQGIESSINELLSCLSKNDVTYFDRDLMYLKRRYLNHPVHDYSLYHCGFHNCYLVVRKVGMRYLIIDFLGDVSKFKVSLIEFYNEVPLVGERIEIWASDFMLRSFELSDLNALKHRVGFLAYNQSFKGEHNGFWLTMGDTDFL